MFFRNQSYSYDFLESMITPSHSPPVFSRNLHFNWDIEGKRAERSQWENPSRFWCYILALFTWVALSTLSSTTTFPCLNPAQRCTDQTLKFPAASPEQTLGAAGVGTRMGVGSSEDSSRQADAAHSPGVIALFVVDLFNGT